MAFSGSDTLSLNDVIDLVHSLSLSGSDDFALSDDARQGGFIEGLMCVTISVIVPQIDMISKKPI